MKRNHIWISILSMFALAALISACQPAAPIEPSEPAEPTPAEEQPTASPQAPTDGDGNGGEGNQNPVVQSALDYLTQNGITGEIETLAVEATEWSDSCLGIGYPDAMCAQVITPGFRMEFSSEGETFTLHTNEDGSQIAVGAPPQKPIGEPLLTWQRTGGIAGVCQTLTIYSFGFAYAGDCKTGESEAPFRLLLSQMEPLASWRDQYSQYRHEAADPATADGFAYELQFNGTGSQMPGDQEKNEMLDFASSLYDNRPLE